MPLDVTNFSSPAYLGFLAGVAAVYWLIPFRRPRKLLLLVASYAFYASWDPRLAGLIATATLAAFGTGLALARLPRPRARRLVLAACCALELSILGLFKYAGFFAESLVPLLGALGLRASPVELQLILPIGISFYTFQATGYAIDVYRGRLAPCRDVVDFALFVAFFPQLVAGPIVRASHFLPQLARHHRLRADALRAGLVLVVVGLAKKIAIADTLGLALVDPVFARPGDYGAAASWLAVLGFACQIYGDFSGYTDVARGSSRIFGYEIPENFRHPYLARSPREFWTRWHISLSTWLRDYLYIPLGGNRGGPARTCRNLMITMVLGGLWHGAAWTFAAWGAFHGAALVTERLATGRGTRAPGGVRDLLSGAATLLVVCAGWVLFRADSLPDAALLFRNLMGANAGAAGDPIRTSAVWLVLLVALSHAAALARERGRARWLDSSFARAALVAGALMGVLAFGRAAPVEFIYFQF